MPPKHPWLFERKRVWYLRAKIPVDLLDALAPREEIKKSLRTRDKVEASRRINLEAAIVQKLFDDYRKHGGPPPTPSKIVRHAKGYAPRHLGAGQAPDDLKSSEQLPAQELQSMLARYWSAKEHGLINQC